MSALGIEAALLSHPNIIECAVVGIKDDTWGEAINAVIVTKDNKSLTLEEIREFAKTKLPAYSVPKNIVIKESLPRNIMGKVDKLALKREISI